MGAVVATDEYGRQFLCSGEAYMLLEDGTLEQWVWLDDDEPFYDLYDENWMHAGPLDGWSLE